MRNSFESNTGISQGKFFERAAFGDTHWEERLEFNHELEKLLKNYEKISVKEAFIENEKIQPARGTPLLPEKPFPNELRTRLWGKLKMRGLTNLKDEDVKYFTSVGYSPLDDYNGIDAYFKVNLPDGQRIITIDVSFKDKDQEDIRADVFKRFSDTLENGDQEWQDAMVELTSALSNKLLSTDPLKMEEPNIMDKHVYKIPWVILKEQRNKDKQEVL